MKKVFVLIPFVVFSLFSPFPLFAQGHMDVWLKNEVGDRITPNQNSVDPYSPRQTCGGCHDYRLITSGYHFTQGFESISDRFDRRRPWILSPGMFGRWLPGAAAGRISPKLNKNWRSMDLSTYDWIGRGGKYTADGKLLSSACGFCHPGGGPMEYGRNRSGRADFSKNLSLGEEEKWAPLDGDYSSLDTPDGRSRFKVSGVVEADCLMCHLPSYDLRERNIQLSKRNYRWAATAGAKLGTVEGAIFTFTHRGLDPSDPRFYRGVWNLEKRPIVHYRWSDKNLFTPEGRLQGATISKRVSARNCLQCHDLGERKNTGTIMTPGRDVHLSKGFTCTDCHGLIGASKAERLTHQVAKGHSPINRLRDDLDGKEMKTCVSCHVEGKSRPSKVSPNPYATHSRIFNGYRFHTYLLDCLACHAPLRPGRALLLLDMSRGYEAAYVMDRLERIKAEGDYFISAASPWSPWMMRTTRYEPAVPKWFIWFGNETNGEFSPIPLRFVAEARRGLSLKKDRPFVVQDEEIWTVLTRLKKMGFENPVFVADKIWGLAESKLKVLSSAVDKVYYPIAHGVAEKKAALRECRSCHDQNSPFFTRMEMVNLRAFLASDFPFMKEPNSLPQFKIWGLKHIPTPP